MALVVVRQDSISAEERVPDSQPCDLKSRNSPPQLTRIKMQMHVPCFHSEPSLCQPVSNRSSLVPCGCTSCLWASVTMCLWTQLWLFVSIYMYVYNIFFPSPHQLASAGSPGSMRRLDDLPPCLKTRTLSFQCILYFVMKLSEIHGDALQVQCI